MSNFESVIEKKCKFRKYFQKICNFEKTPLKCYLQNYYSGLVSLTALTPILFRSVCLRDPTGVRHCVNAEIFTYHRFYTGLSVRSEYQYPIDTKRRMRKKNQLRENGTLMGDVCDTGPHWLPSTSQSVKARHAVKLASLCRSKLFQCVILNTIGSLIRAKCRDELASYGAEDCDTCYQSDIGPSQGIRLW